MSAAEPTAGVLLGLGAAIAWGLSNTFAAFVGRTLDSVRTLAAWQAIGLPPLFVLAAALGMSWPSDQALVGHAILAGVVASFSYVTLFAALRAGPVSVVSPVVAANGGLSVVLSALLLGERVSSVQAAGVAIATIGVLLTAVRFSRIWRDSRLAGPGVLLAILSLVGFGALTVAYAVPSRELGWLPALVISRVTTAVLVGLLVFLPAATLRLTRETSVTWGVLRGRAITWTVAGGTCSVAGFLVFTVGLEVSFAWLVGLTSSFSPVVVVLAGMVWFGERLGPAQWIGVALVFASLPLIALG